MDHALKGERSLTLESRAERFAVDVRHDEVELTRRSAGVVQWQHEWVTKPRQNLDLPLEALGTELSAPFAVENLHNWGDGRTPVESEHWYSSLIQSKGKADKHVSVYPSNGGHGTTAPQQHAALKVVFDWIQTRIKPTPQSFETACLAAQAAGIVGVCSTDLSGYTPNSWWTIHPPEGRRNDVKLEGDKLEESRRL